MTDHRTSIASNLQAFAPTPLRQASLDLLATLGYQSDKTIELEGSKPQAFLDFIKEANPAATFDQKKALFDDWKSADLLFQLTDKEISGEHSLFKDTNIKPGLLRSYLFFAIELTGGDYARGKLTAIARQLNRAFPMPVMVLIKHLADKQPVLSIAVINRRRNKTQADKDVLEKTTIIRDISLTEPHRGHLDILNDLAFDNLVHPQKLPINSFDTLHTAWEQIFNVELLNNRFYKELSNWYFWALPQVEFPDDLKRDDDDEKRRATGLIRMLTRLVFCWFLKEKRLIPDKLFHTTELAQILKGFDSKSDGDSNYYQAILQNLFFATLNQRMGKPSTKDARPYRRFISSKVYRGKNKEHGILNLFRYPELFADPATALDHFADTPFLNGGLFECLDREDPKDENRLRRIDGFTSKEANRPKVPNHLFFSDKISADLSKAYGDNKRKKEPVTGLINILNGYKFTIVENTPIDQEIALDPELLGKVFENLLASYNEETKATARKQTGSFYTPRPIVDYMVDESLKAHLTHALVETADMQEGDAEAGLDILFAYREQEHAFTRAEVDALIRAIHAVKILDPACGSGAFPMGVLHKLVYLLSKLDPQNVEWEKIQLAKAQEIKNTEERRKKLAEVVSNFADNDDDYGRKLYLIENCLYGVDIQPIAIQISKLRFFISLVCDQQTNREKDNLGIRPLPNLETKFVAANSLIGLPGMATGLTSQLEFESNPRIGVIGKEIENHYHSYFSIQRRQEKIDLQRKVKDLRKEMAGLLDQSGMSPKQSKHIAEWDAFDPQATADFFDPKWMFGHSLTKGFDVVIGNPPYRQVKKGIYSDSQFPYAEGADKGKQNLYKLFVEHSFNMCRDNGVATMIVQSSLMCDLSSAATRKLLLEHTQFNHVIEFPQTAKRREAQVFTSVMQGTCIYQFTKVNPADNYPINISIGNDACSIEKPRFSSITKATISALYPTLLYFPHIREGSLSILEKIATDGSIKPLKHYVADISQGDLNLGTDRARFSIHPSSVRLLRGRYVARFVIMWEKTMEYCEEGFKADNIARNQENIFLISQEVASAVGPRRMHFALTENPTSRFLCGHSVNKTLLKNQAHSKAFLALLNARFMDWYFRITSTNNHVQGYELEQLPIPQMSDTDRQQLDHLATQILTAKANNPTADTSTLEHEIDQHVYQLYQLTPDEIKTIEST